MEKHKCFFCENNATHYDVVFNNFKYFIADVCLVHLSIGLVS